MGRIMEGFEMTDMISVKWLNGFGGKCGDAEICDMYPR